MTAKLNCTICNQTISDIEDLRIEESSDKDRGLRQTTLQVLLSHPL
jgi:hypothetical protein